jgi:alkylation response protein AidB-like acyl-CoA dehydrogenase
MSELPPRMQDKLYHDLILPDETVDIRNKIRKFAEKTIAPLSHEIANMDESKDNFPHEIFRKLAKEDFFKIPFPKKVGGLGLKYPTCATVVAVEELSYISNSVGAIYDVQAILVGNALNKYASDFLKDKYLKLILTGEKLGCFATTEPEASSDLSVNALKTTATKKGDKYIVNGQKRFITNACVSDFVIALAKLDGTMSMLLIELDSEGCRIGEPDKKMGNRGQLTSDIYFENVEVPEENLIGKEGKGLHIALGTLTYGRVGIGASGVGMAQCAFDQSVDYMKKREAFGKKLYKFQYWQFRLAERAIQIDNARNLYSKAALRMDQGVEFPEPEAAGAKYYGTACAVDMARDAVQVFGGYGFMKRLAHDGSTYKVEEIYRDSKVTEIYEGANEIQKLIIARTIFGRDIAIQ